MADKGKQKTPDEIIDDTIQNGGALAIFYFDVHGNSPDALKNIMVDFVSRITQERGVVFGYGEIDEALETEEKLYSTSVEVRVLARDLRTLFQLCVKYLPAGIEILKPHQFKMDSGDIQSILNDMSAYAFNITEIVISKGLNEEQQKEFTRRIKMRNELGKKMLEEKKGEKED